MSSPHKIELPEAIAIVEALAQTTRTYRHALAMEKLAEVGKTALEYARSEHTLDACCNAGDCDACSARPALEKLEALIGGPSQREPRADVQTEGLEGQHKPADLDDAHERDGADEPHRDA
jgi:hypothetical protein